MMRESICRVKYDCTGDQCENDLYFLQGLNDDWDVDFYLPNWKFPNRRLFECDLEYNKLNHDPDKVASRFNKGISDSKRTDKVDIVAVSFGVIFGINYATKYPEDIDKLVLLTGFSKLKDNVDDGLRAFNYILNSLGMDSLIEESSIINISKIDMRYNTKKIAAKSFVYQCDGDRIFSESFPNDIPDLEYHYNLGAHWFCMLDPRNETNEKVLSFLDQ